MNTLSVVIPTYNRCGTLLKAISAYTNQTAVGGIAEIIVVDDGSTDSTGALVSQLASYAPVPIRYFRQDNKGPAAARNVGIREAHSKLILFTDDDIIPEPALAAEHLEWHRRFPEISTAVLGQVTWHPEVRPTPFMKWYGSDGVLFAFAHLSGRTEIDYEYFYSCNISLKTEFLEKCGTFDEDFKVAAYEDCELGYRLAKAGMRLLYNPQALAYHYQHISFDDACRRAKKCAGAEAVFRQKEAGLSFYSARPISALSRLKPLGKRLLWPLKGVMDGPVPLPRQVYRAVFRSYS
jgi:glycosyltransferase involved in cell wall biosynthesis